MKKIVIVNGTATSGKDTFANQCMEFLDEINDVVTTNISTVDQIYKIARKLGWDGNKNEKARKFLSDLKDAWVEYNSGPFNYIVNQVNQLEEHSNCENIVVFAHSREPEEIQQFKDYYKDDCITLLVESGKEMNSNYADANVKNYTYDAYINNYGTLEDLRKIAINFCKKFLVEE